MLYLHYFISDPYILFCRDKNVSTLGHQQETIYDPSALGILHMELCRIYSLKTIKASPRNIPIHEMMIIFNSPTSKKSRLAELFGIIYWQSTLIACSLSVRANYCSC